ncbi:MAG: hypothetical protein RL077_126 [Verrucomicrobiota bacterium]
MELNGGGNAGLGEEVAHGVFEAAADRVANLCHGGGGQAKLREDMGVRPVDRGEGIDEGPVQIEQQGMKLRHAAKRIGLAASGVTGEVEGDGRRS